MKKLLVLAIILSFHIQLFSQPITGKQVYNLRECLDIASKNNPDVKLAYAQVGQASADLTSAFGNFLPSINFNASYTRQLNADGGQTITVNGQNINVGKVEPNSFNMGANASINIFNGFQREKNYSRAQDNLNSVYANIKYVLQKVRMNIYRLYIQTQINAQIVKTRQDNLELGKKNQEKLKAKYEAGASAITSVIAGEADLSDKELQLVRAENDLNQSKLNLLTAMGMQPDTPADFEEKSLPAEINPEDLSKFKSNIGSFEENVIQALNVRDDYKAAKLQISAARTSIDIAGSSYYPSLSAGGGWSWSNSQFSDFGKLGRSYIGLSLNVPIFENFKVNYQVETAKIQLQQAEMQLFQLEQTIRGTLKSAYLNLESSAKLIEISEKNLKSAAKNFEAVQEGMKAGTISNSDYYIGNNMLLTAQLSKIQSVYTYYQAQKELEYALGKLAGI